MHILLVSSDFPPDIGGIAAHVYELAKALSTLGHQVTVASVWHDDRKKSVEQRDGFTLHRISGIYHVGPLALKMHRFMLRKLITELIEKEIFDVVHIHGYAWEAYATRGIDRKLLPVIATMHSSGFLKKAKTPKGQLKLSLRLNHIKQMIAPSHELCEVTTQLRLQFVKHCYYIPNGVDTEKFSKNYFYNEKDKPMILCARRIVPKNGVIYLIRAIPDILKKHPHVSFIFAGSEQIDYAQAVREEVEKLGISSSCKFLGAVPNDEMQALMSSASISVFPSLMEATSIAALESMAMGLAIVATCVGGLPELITDEEHGLLVPPKDPPALTRAICRLLENPDLIDQYGNAARQRVQNEYDWKHIAARTVECYQKALSIQKSEKT